MIHPFDAARRSYAFLARHRWSFPLALLSTVCFIHLAEEIRENELEVFDTAVTALVSEWRGQWDTPMMTLTRVGGGVPMTLLTVVIALVLLVRHRRKEASFLLVSGAGTAVLNGSLKLAFQRTRPDAPFLVSLPDSFSFPSGHAMGSAGVLASLVVIAHALGLRRRHQALLTAVALTLALGIGASRVYFGVHYPSDVLGGQLAAAAWVSAITGWFYPRLLPGEETVARPPVTNEEGGART